MPPRPEQRDKNVRRFHSITSSERRRINCLRLRPAHPAALVGAAL
jgi:hypothetical protein